MWFKNLRVYRLTGSLDLSAEALSEQLSKNRFKPCAKMDFSRFGWVPPLGKLGVDLVHSVGHYRLITARRQEKILPAAAINELLEDKVTVFEEREARKIYRKEKTRFKEDILHSLLPTALTRSSFTNAYFDTKNQLLVVDTASPGKADDFLDCLRAALGELPVVPLSCHGDAADIMTRWVKRRTPKGFELDDECELKNSRDAKNIVRCKQQDMGGEEIKQHLLAGKRVTQLALSWRNAIRFLLSDDFVIKRVKFEDSVSETENDTDDEAARFDQDFSVMTIEVSQLLEDLLSEFGGAAKT
ncbi:MAG: recombination-associated protein RdgC [Pseudomonadota bacterium]